MPFDNTVKELLYISPAKKKIHSISEVQADFILIYYNNKRTIISFLEALSLNHSPCLIQDSEETQGVKKGHPTGQAQGTSTNQDFSNGNPGNFTTAGSSGTSQQQHQAFLAYSTCLEHVLNLNWSLLCQPLMLTCAKMCLCNGFRNESYVAHLLSDPNELSVAGAKQEQWSAPSVTHRGIPTCFKNK